MSGLFSVDILEGFVLSDKLKLSILNNIDEGQENLYEIYSNPSVFKYYSDNPQMHNRRMFDIYLRNQILACKKREIIIWNIEYDKKIIGQVQLFDFDNCCTCAQIAFFLHPRYWNQGISTAVIRIVSKYGISTLGFKRIEAYVYHENIASAKCLEKAGFVREGVLRNKYQIDGRIDDCYIYAKLIN